MADSFDDVCGCPVRELVIWPYEVFMHLEDDGVGDIWLDRGDFECEYTVNASSLDELEYNARKIVDDLNQGRG